MNSLQPNKTALIVFAKRPQIGQGKQRLAADIGMNNAYKAAEILLNLTINTLSRWTDALIISPSAKTDSEWACKLMDRSVISIPQNEGMLGTRLEQIDREVRMLAYTRLIFIGTDAPLLSLTDLKRVSTSLDHYDQVFIPATDGGVVLMASSVPWSGLEQVSWSTEKVFTQLKSLAIQQGLSVQIQKEQTDLDDLQSYYEMKPKLINRLEQQDNIHLQQLMSVLERE